MKKILPILSVLALGGLVSGVAIAGPGHGYYLNLHVKDALTQVNNVQVKLNNQAFCNVSNTETEKQCNNVYYFVAMGITTHLNGQTFYKRIDISQELGKVYGSSESRFVPSLGLTIQPNGLGGVQYIFSKGE